MRSISQLELVDVGGRGRILPREFVFDRLMAAIRVLKLALSTVTIFKAGGFNAFKYNLRKCKVIGLMEEEKYGSGMDVNIIKRAKTCFLLGAVMKWSRLDIGEHVKKRAGIVKSAIMNIKGWRTRGLPFSIAYRQLVIA